MNKKVLTLCAGFLLTGSLFNAMDAINVTTQAELEALIENQVLTLPKGDNELTFGPGVFSIPNYRYLIVNSKDVMISGTPGTTTVKGRFVLANEGITVKDLTIENEPITEKELADWTYPANDWSLYYNKTAISVLANSATITNNKIQQKVTEESCENALVNGITLYPSSPTVDYKVTGNEIEANKATVDRAWTSTAIQLVGESTVTAIGETVASYESADADIDALEAFGNNTFGKCDVDIADYVVTDPTAASSEGYCTYEAVQVTPIMENGQISENSKAAIKDAITNSNANSGVVINADVETVKAFLDELTITNDVAVQCTGDPETGEGAGNVLYGNATKPDNEYPTEVVGINPALASVDGHELVANPEADKYYLLIMTGGDGSSYIVYTENGKATSKKVESVAEYVHDESALWKMESSTSLSGGYEYMFINKKDETMMASASDNANAKKGVFVSRNGLAYGKEGVILLDVNDTKDTENYYSYALYKTTDNYFAAEDLTERYGKYFTLAISYEDEKEKSHDVTGEFKGQLHPIAEVTYSNGEPTYKPAADAATSFMLVNEEGNIIVIDTKDPQYTVEGEKHGYIFTTITPKQWEEYQKASSSEHNYVTDFQIAYDYNDKTTTEAITSIEIGGYKVGLEKKGNDIILVADYDNYLLTDPKISFKLNAGNSIAANQWLTSPSYYTVEVINKSDKSTDNYGKVLGLNEYGNVDWVAPENVDLTQPEGQFAINYDGSEYVLTNRENGATDEYLNVLIDGDLYKVDDNVYAVVRPYSIDTLRITPITTYRSDNGFKRFTAAELNNNTYTIAMTQKSSELNIIENHNDKHRIGLDEGNATEWRIEMPTVKLMDATEDFTRMAADTVKRETAITYWVGAPVNKWVKTSLNPEDDYYAPNTELQICTYVLKNTDNGEYLNGTDNSESTGNAYYICNPDKKTATRIAFKDAGDGTVNLVPVYGYYTYKTDYGYNTIRNWMTGMFAYESDYKDYVSDLKLSTQKIIGGTTTLTGVLKDVSLYTAPSNDVFTINVAEAPTYKKLAQGDKIILTLKENLKDENVLFEDGEFAGMGNRLAHTDINPTLYVDTAYVNREGNFAYQYLLGVRINRVDTTYQCNVPAHGIHRADTTYGDFLVNMVDSAMANKDVHNNKYQYNGEYKLAFVPGYHTNDTLFFTNKAGEVVSKMEVGNGDFNIAKYAFKMIDEDANEFVVETAAGYAEKHNYVKDQYNNKYKWTVASVESKPGYLRWVNDNLVVTNDIINAAVFTMEDSELTATANEEISAENAAVSVVATDGAVVIKGAAGKNVVIATILGKVVANETINSDNETIAVPAGIAVVSVDGESFKVVVK